jgi:predicted MFS family arabinose efflux permease
VIHLFQAATQSMKATGLAYPHYVLAVLLGSYLLNSLDRGILKLLLEPIRQEFSLSDTQLGLLSGLAFAIFYSALAVPVAWVADRWNRRNVLVLAMVVWTSMTALCGFAGSFAALLLARVGVAVGEAGCNPASHSMLADYFPRERRSSALGIYALGASLGTMVTGIVGGWGAEHLGWRGTLLLAAAPGLLLVPLVLFTVAEPVRPRPVASRDAVMPLAAALSDLWTRVSFRHLCFAAALHSFAMYGAAAFNPAFLSRSHGWTVGEVGQLIAMTGVAGVFGTFSGGFASDWLSRRLGDARWQMWLPGVATLAVIPVQLVVYLGSGHLMVAAMLMSGMFSLVFFGPSYATAQALAAPRTRAVAAAVLLFAKAFIGMGMGPLLVGIVSDQLMLVTGAHSLRYALLLVPLVNVWATVHFFLAARHLRKDLAAL